MSTTSLEAPSAEPRGSIDPRTTAGCVNPILSAAKAVFESMLGCSPRRTGLAIKPEPTARYEISGVIGITGRVTGTIVLSLSKATAEAAYERMIGAPLDEPADDARNASLCDAVGELTNMIAGGAKARMERLALSISTPNIVCGENHVVRFPSNVLPMSIDFESEIGPFAIDFGFAF